MGFAAKTDTAFEMLRRDILNGTHPPGRPLRIAALSASYGVSATPLREALSRLEEKQLVTASANRGWRVAPVSLAELEDLEFARLTMETSLLEDAILRGDLDWESAIVAAHHRLTQVPSPIGTDDTGIREGWIAAHDSFHMALLAGGRSSWLKSFYAQTCEQLQRHHQALLFHPRIINPQGPPVHAPQTRALLNEALSIPAHTRLMQAALDRDREAARAAVRAHVEITLNVYRSVISAMPAPRPPMTTREEHTT